MKRYITSASETEYGTWLLDRDGNMEPTILHVPSTTYVGRGLMHLAPTDAEFLFRHDKISASDAELIIKECLVEFLTTQCNMDDTDIVSTVDMANFNNYAELRYCPTFRNKFMIYSGTVGSIITDEDDIRFGELQRKWYPWLQNNFVKVSKVGRTVEFRISSIDKFDWNKVIIDDAILGTTFKDDPSLRYTIVRETREGYKAYFVDVPLNDILEQDDTVLASEYLERKIVLGQIKYDKVKGFNFPIDFSR